MLTNYLKGDAYLSQIDKTSKGTVNQRGRVDILVQNQAAATMDEYSLLNTVNQFIKHNKSPGKKNKKNESPAERRNMRSLAGSPDILEEEPSIVGTPKLYKR